MDDLVMTDVVDETGQAELRARVVAFNVRQTGLDDGRSLGCYLRDDAGDLRAGLDGFTWGGYAMIEWLWVAERERGRGLGRQLVEAAEREATTRGCAVMRVNTHSFQAPGFYRRLGYEEIGFAEDTPVGHGEHFFAKRL